MRLRQPTRIAGSAGLRQMQALPRQQGRRMTTASVQLKYGLTAKYITHAELARQKPAEGQEATDDNHIPKRSQS